MGRPDVPDLSAKLFDSWEVLQPEDPSQRGILVGRE
jgi:hypothetical protein